MVSPTFLDEVRRFCQTTSVRGVPRIINSKSTLQSVTWLLGVLTCSGFLTWQMVVIFDRYFSYRVSTLLVKSPLSENVEFPDITVCNLNPVVHESEMSLSYNDYSHSLLNQFIGKFDKNQMSNDNFPSQDTISLRNALLAYFSSTNAYFTNFPMPVPLHFVSVFQNCSILDCSYYNWNGTENTDYRCLYNIENLRGVYQRWDPSFYKCFTVSLNESDRTTVRGTIIIIDVDDYKEFASNPTSSDIAYSVSSGMQVLIHSPGSIPDMSLGIPIGVGMVTKIMIDQTKVTHLPYPYSNCTTQKTLGVLDDVTPYTVQYCTDICLQNHFLNECGCIANSIQFTANQLNQSNFIICGNLSMNSINSTINYEGVKQIICSTPIKAKYQLACEYKCVQPCEEYTYALTTSAAPWHPRSVLYRFYNSYISGKTRFGNEFASYDALNAANLSKSEKDVIEDELAEAGLIKSRFLQLTVKFKSRTYVEQKDVASFSFDAFGAQIGGVLSLWLGVTIILVFELCEVIVNLLAMSCSAKRNKPTSSEETIATRL